MAGFAGLPIRENAKKIYASWFNDIRNQLILFFGAHGFPETQVTIADNQAGWTDIPGLVLDNTKVGSQRIEYSIYRTNGAGDERREFGFLSGFYKPIAGLWSHTRQSYGDDDALGDTGDMRVEPGTGKVQYKSDSVGGVYVGKMRYKSVLSFDKET